MLFSIYFYLLRRRPSVEPTPIPPTHRPSAIPTPMPTSPSPTPVPSPLPTFGPTTSAPTTTAITLKDTYIRAEITLSLALVDLNLVRSGSDLFAKTVLACLAEPASGVVGMNVNGIDVNNIVLRPASNYQRKLQAKKPVAPRRAATRAPTPSFWSMPVDTFTFTFKLTTGSKTTLVPSTFNDNSSQLAITNALSSILVGVSPQNVTYVQSSASGTPGNVEVTYALSYRWSSMQQAGFSSCAGEQSCLTTLVNAIKKSMSSTCGTNPNSCFVPALKSALSTKNRVLNTVTGVVFVSSSDVTSVLPPTSAPTTSAPTPRPTRNMRPSFPTMQPTLMSGDVTFQFDVVFSWGLAGCLSRDQCFKAVNENLATSLKIDPITGWSMFLMTLRNLAQGLNSVWGQTVVAAGTYQLLDCPDNAIIPGGGNQDCVVVSTLAPTATPGEPTPQTTSVPTTLAPQSTLSSGTKSNSLMGQLPMIGGVVGGAVVVLLGLVLFMVYGKKNKGEDIVIEEEADEDEDVYQGEMHEQHQMAMESYEQQRNEDDFRERESGGVDVLFNPAHAQYFARAGDNASVTPPTLPPPGTRRITLQLAPKVQQHYAGDLGSVAGSITPPASPILPAARRITIIAKPPVGGVSSSSLAGSPPNQSSPQLPPIGSMRPIYGRASPTQSKHFSGHEDL